MINKKVLILVTALVITAIAFILISIFAPKESDLLTPYLKTKIGTTTESQVERLPNLKVKERQSDTSNAYLFSSPRLSRDNLVITNNGTVIYERAVTVSENKFHPDLALYLKKYGPPEKIFEDSREYGEKMFTYVFASKGLALVANPNTNEVFEIQAFTPISLDEYQTRYGSDLIPEEKKQQYMDIPPDAVRQDI